MLLPPRRSDYGFDPLKLGADPENLKWFQQGAPRHAARQQLPAGSTPVCLVWARKFAIN